MRTAHATHSVLVPTGMPTSKTARSTQLSSSTSCARPARPSCARRREQPPAKAPTLPTCASTWAEKHQPSDRHDLESLVRLRLAIESVRGSIKHATGWVIAPIGPNDVAVRVQDVEHDERTQRQHRDVPDANGDGIRLPGQALARTTTRCVKQVHPDRQKIDDLGGLPHQERPPPRPCEHEERQQPEHVLRRVDLVENQEQCERQEEQL